MKTMKDRANQEYSITLGLSFLFIITMLNGAYSFAKTTPSLSTDVYDLCFSPEGECDTKIIEFINSAQKSIDVAIYTLTHKGIVSAIEKASNRGVRVRMILDREQVQLSSVSTEDLEAKGLKFRLSSVEGIMHHKFAIIDGQKLETGSYNYTYAASKKNAENQLYIHSPKLIAVYQENFDDLWKSGQ